jgi:predicted glycoside hydrolase/deacetylase ChbG (UPF0249 family)
MADELRSGTRNVVIHVDDVGMCHGANTAFLELSASGFATSGSVMVPCPWYSELAAAARDNPALDVGVHLTLTAEKTHYKWRPLTSPAAESGLTDPGGYLWRHVAQVRSHCDPEAARAELIAQIERALEDGIDVTHLDAHMGVTFAPEFCDLYLELGQRYDVPILLTKRITDYSALNHFADAEQDTYAATVARAQKLGFERFDLVLETAWDRSGPPVETYGPLFESIPPGLTMLALHPNAPGELELIEPDSAYIRTGEYELFSDPEFKSWVDDLGLDLRGFREMRDALRS